MSIPVLLFTTLSTVAVLCGLLQPYHANTYSSLEVVTDESAEGNMGVDNYILLFDLKSYRGKVLPAYNRFMKNSDAEPLIALLREIIRTLEVKTRLPGPDLSSKDSYETDIGVLTGTVYFSIKEGFGNGKSKGKTSRAAKRYFVRTSLGYDLLMALCVPRIEGLDTELGITTTDLAGFLTERSEWIEDLIMGGHGLRGGRLEIDTGESPIQVFTREDTRKFSTELARIGPPDEPTLKKDYDNLRELLQTALKNPDYTLLHLLG